MMLIKKDKVLLYMKFLSALFIIFMITKSVGFIIKISSENITEEMNEEIKKSYNNDICNNYWMFHIFAFVLGAYWNVKKLIKVGCV